MKNKLRLLVTISGWLLLAVFLGSGYFYNRLAIDKEGSNFMPIAWENHVDLFSGALQCTLNSDALLERKQELKEKVFSKVISKKEVENGFIYYFKNDEVLLSDVLEFVQKEKACCPFFKFDISILPFNQGFALQLSGSEAAFEMIKDFEGNEM